MHYIHFGVRSVLIALHVTFLFNTLGHAGLSEQAQRGRELFYDPSFGGTLEPKTISGLACANCHADFDEEKNSDGKIRAGHSIVGVPRRMEAQGGTIKGEAFTLSAGGSGFCYEHFLQRIPADKVNPTAIPQAEAKALMAYFEHVSTNKEGPSFQTILLDKEAANAAADKIVAMEGNAKRGWKLYSRACNDCHPTARKTGIGSQLVRRKAPRNLAKRLHKIAYYVRKGGFVMPSFPENRLSDKDVADIVTFLGELTLGK